MSTILGDRSKVPVTGPDEHVTILNGIDGSPPMLNKNRREFGLGSLSPTSNNLGAHMALDANDRESQEQLHKMLQRKSSQGSHDSRDRQTTIGTTLHQ